MNDLLKWITIVLVSIALIGGMIISERAARAQDTAPFSSAIMITNVQDLQDMNNNLADDYQLANDIDCSEVVNFDPIGSPTAPFTGTFSGNGHTISNLRIDRQEENYVGLFGYVQYADITDLILKDVNIRGGSNVGSLIGYMSVSTVSHISVTGHITGTYSRVGGLIGESYNGEGISHCRVEASVTATNTFEVGGFIGRIWDGYNNNVTDSFYKGTVNATGSSGVGGFAGYNKSGDFLRCFSTGSVVGSNQVGGIAGNTTENAGIHNSYSQSAITGNADVGGIVGSFNSYHDGISHVYYAGTITGTSNVGGFIGQYISGTLQSNYWDYELTEFSVTQDVGNTGDMSEIDGKTTAEMMQQETFIGWDFINIWRMIDYPRLQFESTKIYLPLIFCQTTKSAGTSIGCFDSTARGWLTAFQG